jgi:hypothetical protein
MLTEGVWSGVSARGVRLRASSKQPSAHLFHPTSCCFKLLPSAIRYVCRETEALWVRGLWNTSSVRFLSLLTSSSQYNYPPTHTMGTVLPSTRTFTQDFTNTINLFGPGSLSQLIVKRTVRFCFFLHGNPIFLIKQLTPWRTDFLRTWQSLRCPGKSFYETQRSSPHSQNSATDPWAG